MGTTWCGHIHRRYFELSVPELHVLCVFAIPHRPTASYDPVAPSFNNSVLGHGRPYMGQIGSADPLENG